MKEDCRRIVRSTLLDAETLLHEPENPPARAASPRKSRAHATLRSERHDGESFGGPQNLTRSGSACDRGEFSGGEAPASGCGAERGGAERLGLG